MSLVAAFRGRRPWQLRLLVLAIADRCDQRCAHCSIWSGAGSLPMLTPEQRLAVVDEALQAGIEEVLLTGGEPLLAPDLWALCERLRQGGARVMLATNGMLLERYATQAAALVDALYLSLDGASASTHDGLRGVPALARLRAGVRALRGQNATPQLVTRSTLHAKNLDEFEGIVATARELGVDHASFLPLDASSEAFGGAAHARRALVPSAEQIARFEAAVDRLEARGELSSFVVESAPRLKSLARHLRASAGLAAFEPPACDSPWWSVVVEADGRLRPCFFQAPTGDVMGGIMAAIGSPAYAQALAQIRAPNPTCERCVCPKLRGPGWLRTVGLGS